MRKTEHVWITKYALTEGVIECDAEVISGVAASGGKPWAMFGKISAFGRDWHRTRESAVERVRQMIKTKRATMKRNLVRLADIEKVLPDMPMSWMGNEEKKS